MKRLILPLLIVVAINGWSQDKKFQFGLYGGVIDHINIAHTQEGSPIRSNKQTSLVVGGFLKLTLSEQFELRMAPGFTKQTDMFSIIDWRMTQQLRTVELSRPWIVLPAHIMFHPEKGPVYLVAGFTSYFSLNNSNSKLDSAPPSTAHPLMKGQDYSGDVGAGYAVQTGKFVITPEVRYSQALTNALGSGTDGSAYHRNRISFALHFQLSR